MKFKQNYYKSLNYNKIENKLYFIKQVQKQIDDFKENFKLDNDILKSEILQLNMQSNDL